MIRNANFYTSGLTFDPQVPSEWINEQRGIEEGASALLLPGKKIEFASMMGRAGSCSSLLSAAVRLGGTGQDKGNGENHLMSLSPTTPKWGEKHTGKLNRAEAKAAKRTQRQKLLSAQTPGCSSVRALPAETPDPAK